MYYYAIDVILVKFQTETSRRQNGVSVMTCYFKNSRMKELLRDIGVEGTKENIKKVDEILHEMLSVDYPNCAATWKMLRKKLQFDGEGFKERLSAIVQIRMQS